MFKLSKFIYQKARASRGHEVKPKPAPRCQHRQKPIEAVCANEAEGSYIPARDQPDKCQICQAQTRDARIYRSKLIGGLLLPEILSSFDLTIVATATPFISSHFGTPPSPPQA